MTMPTKQQNVKEIEEKWRILKPKFEELISVRRQGRSSYFLFPQFSLHITADVYGFTLEKVRGEASWSIQRLSFGASSECTDIVVLGMGKRALTLKISSKARMILDKKEEV